MGKASRVNGKRDRFFSEVKFRGICFTSLDLIIHLCLLPLVTAGLRGFKTEFFCFESKDFASYHLSDALLQIWKAFDSLLVNIMQLNLLYLYSKYSSRFKIQWHIKDISQFLKKISTLKEDYFLIDSVFKF